MSKARIWIGTLPVAALAATAYAAAPQQAAVGEEARPAPTRAADANVDATDRKMLQALLKRRAEVAASTSLKDKHYALEFLDREIARVRTRQNR